MFFSGKVSDKHAESEYWLHIWEKFRSGDKQAFNIIYNEYVDKMFAYGIRITTDKDLVKDAIQDMFIDVYTYSKNLHSPESLEYYLYKSLKRNLLRKLIKKKRFNDNYVGKFDLVFPIENPEFEMSEIKEKRIKLMSREISNLNSRKRELLFLKFNSGLTFKEIGKLLEINPDTAKKQVQRVLKYLRKKLEPGID